MALSVTFLFAYEISRQPLNGFAPNSQGRRVWFLARTSFNVKVKGQRSRSSLNRDKNGIFGPFVGLRAVMFGKTYLAFSYFSPFSLGALYFFLFLVTCGRLIRLSISCSAHAKHSSCPVVSCNCDFRNDKPAHRQCMKPHRPARPHSPIAISSIIS